MFENMLRIVCQDRVIPVDRQEPTHKPDVIVRKEGRAAFAENKGDSPGSVDSKYSADIEALKYVYGNLNGQSISIDLQGLLSIVPRNRRRCEAYLGLQTMLRNKYGCTLHITSRKTK